MKKLLIALFAFVGCDYKSPSTSNVSYTCFFRSGFSEAEIEQADMAGLDYSFEGDTLFVCGDQTQIEGIVAIGEPQELAEFLETAEVDQ